MQEVNFATTNFWGAVAHNGSHSFEVRGAQEVIVDLCISWSSCEAGEEALIVLTPDGTPLQSKRRRKISLPQWFESY